MTSTSIIFLLTGSYFVTMISFWMGFINFLPNTNSHFNPVLGSFFQGGTPFNLQKFEDFFSFLRTRMDVFAFPILFGE
jgi:hypothetical protein